MLELSYSRIKVIKRKQCELCFIVDQSKEMKEKKREKEEHTNTKSILVSDKRQLNGQTD